MTNVFSKNIHEEGFLRRNENGELLSSVFIDQKEYRRFNKRLDKLKQINLAFDEEVCEK